ncbi:hypothetical protein EOPP23_01510 [Endozoicomonas sp. OPT23]|uniref:carbohydrate porin n=1 Tax=Endozoicomonas sp. OPT23 TaxID=2072845 RepID=UPI00129ABCB4|nr:carbohydrate porin [Endozoicomonas sp. OPT23]MRI31671.1 hypothetical protein [Endozoicomonas sp. OPT23]
MNKKTLLAGSIALALSSSVFADLSLDASLELNTDMVDTSLESAEYKQSGFVELGATARREMNDYFIAAKGAFRIKTSDSMEVRDAYIQLGNSAWDVQAGRFEAVNLFPLGKDTMVEHAGGSEVSVYEANNVRGRLGKNDSGQVALHVNATENLKFELATAFGDFEGGDDVDKQAFTGVRPALMWSSDVVNLTLGYEQVKYDKETTTNGVATKGKVNKNGFGANANFNVSGAGVNLSLAQSKDKESKDKVNSYAINVTYGDFGAGYIHSKTDFDAAASKDTKVGTTYAAYTMPLLGIEGASATVAGSYSTASDVTEAVSDKTTALRLRLNYTF